MKRLEISSALLVGTLITTLPFIATSQQSSPNLEKQIFHNIYTYNAYHMSCSGQERIKWPVHYIYLVKNKISKTNISLDSENFIIEEEDRSACANLSRKVTRGKSKVVEFKNNINAVSKVSYHSKYARYDFLEQYVIDKEKTITNTSMRIKIAERIFITSTIVRKSGVFILLEEVDYNNLVRDVDKYGALNRDIIFEKMFAQAAKRIRGSSDKDDRYVAVFIPNFFVKPGSVITIEHHYTWPERKRRKAWNSFGKDFAVKKVQPFIFFPTTAWGSFDGQVKFSAFLDGNVIHDETFEIVAP